MRGYNRVRSLTWPVVFQIDGGQRFTVDAPVRGPEGLRLRCRVESGQDVVDREIGAYYNERSAGAIIGRTIRWWVESTGVGVSIAPTRSM